MCLRYTGGLATELASSGEVEGPLPGPALQFHVSRKQEMLARAQLTGRRQSRRSVRGLTTSSVVSEQTHHY